MNIYQFEYHCDVPRLNLFWPKLVDEGVAAGRRPGRLPHCEAVPARLQPGHFYAA